MHIPYHSSNSHLVVSKMGSKWLLMFFLVYIAFDIAFAQSCTGFNCLEEYVNAPDDAFAWYDSGMLKMNTVCTSSINLNSFQEKD